MKEKEFQQLQAEMFVKTREWKKLDDELLADKALINRINRPKGGLDHYYNEVNNSGYGIRFDLALDGIYNPDKLEGPKEVIPRVGNIEFVDHKILGIDEEKEYDRVLVREVVDTTEEFIDGEKMDGEIVCEHRPGNEHVDGVEEYINKFFKKVAPLKHQKIAHTN